jgi:hypothetical protein
MTCHFPTLWIGSQNDFAENDASAVVSSVAHLHIIPVGLMKTRPKTRAYGKVSHQAMQQKEALLA